jgi:ankyrin repeat protein
MGRKAVTGWVPATLCRGYPLGHTDPSLAFALHRWHRRTALHLAAEHGHLRAVNALIHAGAPLDIQDNGTRWALLCGGSAQGRIGGGSARASAAAHAAVARRWTPLLWAAIDGHADAMAALLGAGADASIEDKFG